jgi:hypothetical protein
MPLLVQPYKQTKNPQVAEMHFWLWVQIILLVIFSLKY